MRRVEWLCDGCNEICTQFIYIDSLSLYIASHSGQPDPIRLDHKSRKDSCWHKECFFRHLTEMFQGQLEALSK